MAKKSFFIPQPYRQCIGMAFGRFGRGGIAAGTATALAAMLIAGCGSSYSRADFVTRAEAICTSTLDAVRELTPPDQAGSRAARDASLAAYLEELVPLMRRQLRRLRALPPPPQTGAQARAVHAYTTALGGSIAQFTVLAGAARSGKGVLVTATEAALASGQLPRLAAASGLRTCSSSGATYS
jgi:hypothetical protein